MQIQHINSSNIDAVAYHRGLTLVRFKSGGVYAYANTSFVDYMSLANAESVGKHFHKHFNGKFPFTKLDADPIPTH